MDKIPETGSSRPQLRTFGHRTDKTDRPVTSVHGQSSSHAKLCDLARQDIRNIKALGQWVDHLPTTMTNVMPGLDSNEITNYIEGLRHEGLGLSFLEMSHNGLKFFLEHQAPTMEKSALIEGLKNRVKHLGQGVQRANNNFRTYMANLFEQTAIRPCDEVLTQSAS